MPRRTRKELDKAVEFEKLQKYWYAKLKKTGFIDIEGGRDLAQVPGQTLRGAGPNSHVLWDFERGSHGDGAGGYRADGTGELQVIDETCDIGGTDKFEYFDRISHFAHSLPNQDSLMARLLIDLSSGAPGTYYRKHVARKHKTTLAKANTIWEATIQALGLPALVQKHSHAAEKPPEPAPVRSLSAKEIAGLNYTPPKKISR